MRLFYRCLRDLRARRHARPVRLPSMGSVRAGLVGIASLACLGLALPTTLARAQDNSGAVEQLFVAGKRLMAEGKVAEACPKFLASYKLEHRVGTLLNLAECYERNRQLGSAWARFIEARTLAVRAGQPERADYASQHAATIEGRRSMLTIVADGSIPGLSVTRDGEVVDPAVYGVALPVDGGSHTIEASAPGKASVSATITVLPESETKTYTVSLVDAAAPPVLGATSPAVRADAAAAPSHGLGARAVAGIVVAGVGVVAAGIGGGFGVDALSKNSQSSAYCGGGTPKDDCWGLGVPLRNRAVSEATVSSVLIGVGAAAFVGGIVLWLTAPSSSKPAASVAFDGRTLRLGGTF